MRVVNNFSEIKDMSFFINSVVSNPVANEITSSKDALNKYKANLNSTERNIEDYKKAMEDLKLKSMMYHSEMHRLERKLKALENVASKQSNDTVLKELTAKKFDDFLRPLGLRFFTVHSTSSGETIILTLAREAKPVSYVITPPLLLRITYTYNRENGTYYLNGIRAMPLVHFNEPTGYVHPHINSSSDTFKGVCMGNYLDVLRTHKVPTQFSNWQDHCLLLDQLLSTYNPDSPYIGIQELASRMRRDGYTINDRDETGNSVTIDSASKFVLFAEGLEQNTVYNPENILTKGMFDRFEQQVHALDTKTLLTDLIAHLTMIYFTDEETSYEKLNEFISSMPIEVSGMEDLSDYSGAEGEYIEEDQFETLKDAWIRALTEEIPKKKSIKINRMPKEKYEYYFGKDETEKVEATPTETTDETDAQETEHSILLQ